MFAIILFLLTTWDVRQIPYSNDWRGSQPTAKQLDAFLSTHKIQYVIRMNSSKESPSIPISIEKAICAKHKVNFVFINAHEGYVKGEGYLTSAKKTQEYLTKYSCLIHCKYGFDRTGAMVGYFLKKKNIPPAQIIQHNRWKNYLKIKGNAYKKYYETGI